MLPLKEKERFKVNADMTVSQIRSYKRSLKEKAKEQKSLTDALNTLDTLVQTSKKKKSVATSQSVPRKRYCRMREAALLVKVQAEPVCAVAVAKQ